MPPHSTAISRIAFVGDTQRTLASERVIGREQNDAERTAILNAIIADRPQLLVHLGDLTNKGADAANWKWFDQFTQPLRSAQVPVLAVFGNHDYWGSTDNARARMHERFSALAASHWYTQRCGPLLLILLDSNHEVLFNPKAADGNPWERQSAWLSEQLRRADADPTIRGVLLCCHHPPYTNSRWVIDDPKVQSAFVEPLRQSRKGLGLISGHVHSYERFVKDGRHFIVSGGGGGPRPTLLKGDQRRHPDDLAPTDLPTPRPFHFVLATVTDGGVKVQVKGLDKDEQAARMLDSFEIQFPH